MSEPTKPAPEREQAKKDLSEEALSAFTSELETAREELQSLMGDGPTSMDDIEKYMTMKKSALKKVEDEAAAGEMADKDAARGFFCSHCYPYEEWATPEGVPKGACCICPPCAMCPINCPLKVPCCFPLTVFGICRNPPLCFKLCPRNNPFCTLLGVPCIPVCNVLGKPALVCHCKPPCECCRPSVPECCCKFNLCKTVGCNCVCFHCTCTCCPVCCACLCADELLHKGNNHIYLKKNAPEGNEMDRI